MATRIIEYGGADRSDDLPVIPESQVIQARLTASGSSQQSAAFGNGTTLVAVDTDETVHVARGANPTATVDNFKVVGGTHQFFSVKPGHKVAIIAGS